MDDSVVSSVLSMDVSSFVCNRVVRLLFLGLLQLVPLAQESARYSSDRCLEEMPPMVLPLVDISTSLQEGQCLQSPCHWIPEYVQYFCLHLHETHHFEGMHPFVSCFRGRVRSPYIYHVLGVNTSAWAPCSCPLSGIRGPLGYGWFSSKLPSLLQLGLTRYEASHPFAS
eukprot:Gb_25393 [translate_table: standard]